MTLTMSLTWMLFCSESSATAKRLSFFLVTAWCRTVTTFPYMFSTWGQGTAQGTHLGGDFRDPQIWGVGNPLEREFGAPLEADLGCEVPWE